MVFPIQWFLDRVGSGVTLTAAGYLPTAVIADAKAAGLATGWGASRREIDVPEVANLRDVCTHLRLVRPVMGTLRVTKLGQHLAANPAGLWWHLADALPHEPGMPTWSKPRET